MKNILLLLIIGVLVTLTSYKLKASELTPAEAKEIAKEAYVYGLPLILNYKTMNAYVLNKKSPEYKGEFNELTSVARLYTPDDKAVVTPNSDTPFSFVWVDLRDEPQVISLPEVEEDRYYSFQLIDLYTHNFAYLGTLSTGNKAGKYLMAKQGWTGEKPEGVDDVIYCETDLFFALVRTQLMNDKDLENVKKIQASYKIESLSSLQGTDKPKSNRIDDVLAWNEGDQFTADGFKYLDAMFKLIEPVASEIELRKRFAKLGIGTEKGFDINSFDDETQKAINEGIKEGFAQLEKFINDVAADPLNSTKIFGTREHLTESAKKYYNSDNFYIPRAVAAHMGLYGNSAKEALYPSYIMESPDVPYNTAENNYTLTFKKGELPPVNVFWSFSMYDAKTQLLIHNSLNRYLLNSNNMDGYVYNDDGSLTLYIQKESPGKELESNWLPAPNGPFYCMMRLYGPKPEALSGKWVSPGLIRNN